ncbi:MAG: hypothetical protein K2M49_00520 [Muribaculaceae bacterium]|nr:hypothetical protein [Muribaculaceae bacterium]
MRSLILLFMTCALIGCKSQKNVVARQSVKTDSLAHSEHHRSITVIDSLIRNIDFSFDTLKINIERPVEYAEAPEIIRLTATNGRVIDSRKLQHNQVENYNRLDTVAYHQSAVESSAEHSATTRLYNPPSGTAVAVVALIIAGVLIYIFMRKK